MGRSNHDSYNFLAIPATHDRTIIVLAPEQLFVGVLNHDLVFAEWAFLETLDACSLDLLPLLHTLVQLEQLGRQESAQFRVGKLELASRLVHAYDIVVILTQLCRSVR